MKQAEQVPPERPVCPRCHSLSRKNGKSRHGHQRWLCKGCGATFGEMDRRRVELALRQSALSHHAEGIGLRAIERLVGVSHNSVTRWVRQEVAGKALAKLDAADVHYVQADELWSYVGSKKQHFGSGGLLIRLPSEYSAGRWAIATPRQPRPWLRSFLATLASSTAPTAGATTRPSSRKTSTFRAKPTPSSSRA